MLRRALFAAHVLIFGAVNWRDHFLNRWRLREERLYLERKQASAAYGDQLKRQRE
jgi:hypothetical protein